MKSLETEDGRFSAGSTRGGKPEGRSARGADPARLRREHPQRRRRAGLAPRRTCRAVTAEAQAPRPRHAPHGARLLERRGRGSGIRADDYGREFDTVSLCLSKGSDARWARSSPLGGAAWPGARRLKHLFGGAMRQAGIVAAAGLYALDHHVERLADDHANARRLAEGLAEAGMPVDLDRVETNFVLVDVGALGLGADDAVARLRAEGVLLVFRGRATTSSGP